MTWVTYQVTFRLLSPMHIGWRKLGNLQQTRPYVTGRSLWGALTARITRELGSSDYEKIGKQADQQLAFTYFYPSTSKDPDEISLWPWEDNWDKFAWAFLGSYASTALENGRSAEAGSLHETEFIAPYTRDEEPVYLIGYIFENDSLKHDNPSMLDKWQDVLGKLQLGGERSYGWGRVCLEKPCNEVKNNKCFGYELDCNGDHPKVKVPKEQELLAHTDTENVDSTGAIEPFLGRETRDSTGFGKNFSKHKICWVPGSKVLKDETFLILEKGIWERYPLN